MNRPLNSTEKPKSSLTRYIIDFGADLLFGASLIAFGLIAFVALVNR